MKRFLLPLAAVTIAGLLLPAGVRPAYAFACAPVPLAKQVEAATFVLTGTVTEYAIKPPLDPEKPDDAVHRSFVTVRVDEYLKGTGPNSLTVPEPNVSYSFRDDGELGGVVGEGAIFDETSEGKRYVLFLGGTVDAIVNRGDCSGSGTYEEEYVEQVRAVLAEPADLPGTGGPPPAESQSNAVPWLAISLAAALAAASTLLLRRRLTRR
jgi:hypothetical protein